MKKAKEFGAILCDPYSHKLLHCSAQQPGMKGLEKKEIFVRFMEPGVTREVGRLAFCSYKLMSRNDFCNSRGEHRLEGAQRLRISERQIGFTLTGVPAIYGFGERSELVVSFFDGG